MSVNIRYYYVVQFCCIHLVLTNLVFHKSFSDINSKNRSQPSNTSQHSETNSSNTTDEVTDMVTTQMSNDSEIVLLSTSSVEETTLQVANRFSTDETDQLPKGEGNKKDTSNKKTDFERHNYNSQMPAKVTVRKCLCPKNQFRNIESEECELMIDSNKFESEVKQFSNNSISVVHTYVEKLQDCIELQTPYMNQNSIYYIITNGTIYDASLNMTYSHSEYCLELVGEKAESSELLLAFCPRYIPKCCQIGHFFDIKISDCLPYDKDFHDGDSLLDPFFNKHLGFVLSHNSQFICDYQTPKVDMKKVYIEGNNICIKNTGKCYGGNKFCIDNMLENDGKEMIQAAYMCPDNIINKCCPDGKRLHKGSCVNGVTSPTLMKILENHVYLVRNISDQLDECDSLVIENDTDSRLTWLIDAEGTAILNISNEISKTNIFCVDNTINGNVVLYVCSNYIEEFQEHSHVQNRPDNILGKCCPPSMVFFSETAECKKSPSDIVELTEIEELQRHNISHLQHVGFPSCSESNIYHTYRLGKSDSDYAKFTNEGNLKIVQIENNCTVKETEIKPIQFCLEFTFQYNKHNSVAFVCVPDMKTIHSEKTIIVVSLVALSCAALTVSLVMLVGMRIQRGITRVRKVNTLAGKILVSYVSSQLIGYLALGVGTIADFGERSVQCYLLTGFLQFFMMAAFCWNTSICIEGFLLTLNVRTSEFMRFIFHSIWAWGMPATLTAITFMIDHYSDQLPCNVIAPKIGVDRCFLSNSAALLLYFYVPISITVMLNAVLLISSKALRTAQLRKLEHNLTVMRGQEKKENSQKRNGDTSLNHSGLRTHQNKNMWMESLRMVLWSGTTWLMEIIGIIVTIYGGNSQGEWYNYLWYLPVGFNCLRGLGIFFLIYLTSQQSFKLEKLVRNIACGFGTTSSKRVKKTRVFKRSISEEISSDANDTDADDNNESRIGNTAKNTVDRTLSTTTLVSDISLDDAKMQFDESKPKHSKVFHSISQL